MKQLLSFIKKEVLHILRDKRTILILLIMPVVQILLFGFAMTMEVKNIKVAVSYQYGDDWAEKITARISASEYFNIVKTINNPLDISSFFKKEKIDTIIVFSDDFSSEIHKGGISSVQIINDASDPNQASTVTSYISAIISSFQNEIAGRAQPVRINTELKMLYNPELKGSYNFVPGVMALVLTLICAMMTSISIVREKEFGTMELLLVSPMKPAYIIISKIVPYFIISTINLLTIIILAVMLLDMPVRGSFMLLMAVSFLFIFVCLTIGIFISSLVSNQAAAMLISGMGMMMPVMLLSGMLFPLDSMPKFLQIISDFVPASWYFTIVKKIMIEGQGLMDIIKEIIILTIMLAVLVIASIKKFKVRLG